MRAPDQAAVARTAQDPCVCLIRPPSLTRTGQTSLVQSPSHAMPSQHWRECSQPMQDVPLPKFPFAGNANTIISRTRACMRRKWEGLSLHLAGDVVVREGAAARPVLLGAQRARRPQVGLELAQLRLLRAQLLLLQVQLLRAPPVPVLFRRLASSAAASSGHGPAGRPAAQPLSDHFSALQSRTEAVGCWNTPQGAAHNAHSLAPVQCIWQAAVLGNKSGACLRRDASNDPGSRAPHWRGQS